MKIFVRFVAKGILVNFVADKAQRTANFMKITRIAKIAIFVKFVVERKIVDGNPGHKGRM